MTLKKKKNLRTHDLMKLLLIIIIIIIIIIKEANQS